jgi:hypothetical protein
MGGSSMTNPWRSSRPSRRQPERGNHLAQAIYQMEKGGLRTVFSRAVYAAFQRTQTLAKEEKGREGE